MESESHLAPEPIPYESPTPSHGNKVWAGVAITLAGLMLALIGGCFLIGVMLISNNGFNGPAQPMNNASLGLVLVLYVLAGISFLGAAFVLYKGLVALFRVLRS